MKKILSVMLFLVSINFTYSQNAYYDALYLKSNYNFSHKGIILFKDVKQLLMNYYPGNNEDAIDTALVNLNPFFNGLFLPQGLLLMNNKSFTSEALSSLGGIDVTKYAQGVSLFLIDRAKQELNIAFFQKFKNFVEKNDEIRILFPNTNNTLNNLLAYQYSQMLPVLQVAFYKDMEILPQNLIEVLSMDKYYARVKDLPELLIIINTYNVLQQISHLPPPQLIESLLTIADSKKFPELENLQGALTLVTIFSNAIRTNTTNYNDALKNFWISPEKVYDSILQNPITFKIFLGLIYQQILNENIKVNNKLLTSLIKNKDNEILWYKLQFSKLLTQVDKISNAAKNLQQLKDKGNKPTDQDIYMYVNTTIDLFEFGYDLTFHYNPNLKKLDKYIELVKNANGLYINVVSKKYALAMNNAIHIFNAFNKNPSSEKIFTDNILTGVSTYGTFIANIADADSPQEVQAALEAAALPAGSSSYKKNYVNNIALNAYLGINAGNWPKDNSSSPTWNGNFRLTAPIGIAWTPFSFGKGGALSIFASILDIGAIVDYQLKGDSANQEINQKIYLANIFSPGGYLVYGMAWNLPVSIGFGGQYGPGLIKMGDNLWNPNWRWNFFIAVDIPIFNLHKGTGKILK